MRTPRGLSAAEAALWARVASTIDPLHPARPAAQTLAEPPAPPPPVIKRVKGRVPPPLPAPPPKAMPPRPLDRHGLDGTWERKLAKAQTSPDLTLDLHGHSLDAAHARLDAGLLQAVAMGARLLLVITGKPRPVAAADRGERRGAIRAKLLDWLAAGPHASRIAAVRPAHQRHGGSGALYVILRRPR
ncbi:Smr/MutS family protein [Novosphingobium ginsenosidimutans]|uniref:Smr/MutS family protein n=1 Tax=Novosphingobium ginsenosidimutans TaxID=1176536 RepID=A0A5B8S125_9SPHN|nr:Smr/MutS family protein [Novosphingobium ginsenosidimutans]QEA15236.1 Smr/MutS family protein [Novosphingobium ginsenosidimutans]